MSRYDASWSADEIRADMELREARRALRRLDGLLTPGLPLHVLRDPYARPTRQIGDHNMNLEAC